jgi:hypothetical protein
MELNVIVGYAVCATNVYHTSGEAAFPQKAFIPAVAVEAPPAFLSVPAVFVHEVPEVNVVALPHASLPGCADEIKGNTKKMINPFVILNEVVRVFTGKVIYGFN